MDDRGFIFTADASFALIVIMIVTASIVAYIMAPYFMGQDHEHLQALASDALETMEQDGTLYLAAVKYNEGNISGAEEILNGRLSLLIPADTNYNLNMMGHYVTNNSRVLVAGDTATAVRVISGPREGFLGRAWYKQEEVQFEDKQINVIGTVWNFHNYLTNFHNWYDDNGLYTRQYWGVTGSSPGTASNIQFSIPQGATIHNAFFLQGTNNVSANSYDDLSYGVRVNINGHTYGNTTPFTMLYPRVDQWGNINYGLIYNYKGNINASDLTPGTSNYFNVYFNYQNLLRSNYDYNMPWFSIIANYTTTIQVPAGILSIDENFPDAAGLARPDATGGNNYGKIYDLNTGTVTNLTTERSLSWNTYASNRNALDNFDDGRPFYFINVNGEADDGSAVSVVKEFNIPDNARIFDGYVNVNAYGAVDNALVEVWDGTQWRAVFCSFDFRETPSSPITDFSARSDGYGNTPGIIYIGDKLHTGNNKVRITVWDQVPSSDYDLVGLVDSKVYVSYSFLPIKWDTFAFNSYQAGSGQSYTFPNTNGRIFSIGPDATKLYLFTGAGTTSRRMVVEVRNTTSGWATVYDDTTIPYMLDLASLDAAGPKRFTSGTAGNYTLHQGSGYRVRVTLYSPRAWESGDGASVTGGISTSTYGNPTIFSGTRIAVIYPKFIQNNWAISYNSTAEAAKAQAKIELIILLEQMGIHLTEEQKATIQTEAIYTGNMPNSLPVRLDLWK